jgi:hypothetical protein
MPISTAPEAEKRRRKSGVFFAEKHQPDAGPDAVQDGPARPVSAPRVCDRTLVWPDQLVRSAHLGTEERCTQNARPARPLVLGTGASGHVRSDASGHVRSDASGRGGSLLDSERTLGAARPVKR